MNKTYDFQTVTKMWEDWETLHAKVDSVSRYVFLMVLEMKQGYVCERFHFEIRSQSPQMNQDSGTITYELPEQVVVQEYQNGSHVEPYANAQFSYPIDWLNCSIMELDEMFRKNPELKKLARIDNDGSVSEVWVC